MKKLLLTLCISLALLSSCSENNDEKNSLTNDRISSVLKETNYDNQKMMYSLLNKEDKFYIWKNKIDELLKNHNLNYKQQGLLVDLKNHLSIHVFDNKNNDESEIFKVVYANEFLNKAQKIFSTRYIGDAFFTLNSTNNRISAAGGSSCNCSKDSAVTCALGGTLENPVYCGSATCKITPSNCGWLFQYDCNGVCKTY